MPGTFVWKCSSTTMRLRLSSVDAGLLEAEPLGVRARGRWRRARRRPRPSPASPPAAGSIVTLQPPPSFSTPVTLRAELEARCPASRECAGTACATSPSMPGRMRSRNSTTSDLGAEPPPDGAELQPDDAGADHQQPLRHLRQAPARRSTRRCVFSSISMPGSLRRRPSRWR